MALRKVMPGAIAVVALVSVALNVLFLYSRAAEDTPPVSEESKATGSRGTLERGMRVPVLEGRTAAGDRVRVDYGADNRPTLL